MPIINHKHEEIKRDTKTNYLRIIKDLRDRLVETNKQLQSLNKANEAILKKTKNYD